MKTIKDLVTFAELYDTRDCASSSENVLTPFLPVSKYKELEEVLENAKKEDINVEDINKLFYYLLESTKQMPEYAYPFMPTINYANEDSFNGEIINFFVDEVTSSEIVTFVENEPGLNEKLMNWVDFFNLVEKFINKIHDLGIKWWMDQRNFDYLNNIKGLAPELIKLISSEYKMSTSTETLTPALSKVRDYEKRKKVGSDDNEFDIIKSCFGYNMGFVYDYPACWGPKKVEKGWDYIGPFVKEYAHYEYCSSI